MSMATEVGTLLALLALLLALPETPPGAVLLEAESFARCEWAVLDEPTAGGGQWVRSNLADQVAETVAAPTDGPRRSFWHRVARRQGWRRRGIAQEVRFGSRRLQSRLPNGGTAGVSE